MKNLTNSQKYILELIKEGYANNEIAEKLFVSTHTVKAHIASILGKTSAKNRTHLIYLAMKNGLLK